MCLTLNKEQLPTFDKDIYVICLIYVLILTKKKKKLKKNVNVLIDFLLNFIQNPNSLRYLRPSPRYSR